MASSKIDWDRDLAFEDGAPAYISAQVFATGRLAVRNRHGIEDIRSESYAELYEQGVRYLVARSPNAGAGAPFNEWGFKVAVWGAENTARVAHHSSMPNRVINANTTIDLSPMEDIPGWGSF